ncbi:Serine/Threonine kinase domain protein (macronuclear) [Tetrahymena thermophila SB210]|uniref:Serine/Threonine kinase domain protein n=1 Tax=Tetrahymena thermophila (strain SB210) TaxID=312017 RepID=Q23KL5_TETTS|nr:Serine/Threonine kinase domain protein [Tetrahymena thermophila SB210]EAR96828.2 Serine/Threonine kinase domain protein [Tetrahymena thermophila SB210]|eukprot:XP_001017073.2 Serine/Threonine kinase domain protein [Tetrahymena thermophila SB210]
MPKIVDNYVLERKIGSGQFGDVFKGYNKVNNQDIAIKVVKRELLKGKFNELLENEIRVLRTCNNENIIKLYDIKKTANNFYLMLEYCNEGDLMQYQKEKKYLTEDEAIEFLIQILNAFKTLVKNKIMHRDFKLANILKHNGNIKIADFGFAKLLGNDNLTSTMLGSPLNMAPEVLDGQDYNNKADIWSIGTVFYELLFGRPPYTAGNMIDLIKNIRNKPLEIPKKINKISDVTEDIIRKMLVVDPRKRIEWDQLFSHKINNFLEDKIKNDLEATLKDEGLLSMNMSRFYIKNNKVIQHPSEIEKKQEINNYAINVAKAGKNQNNYQGAIIKRQTERVEEVQPAVQNNQAQEESKQTEEDEMQTKESVREAQIRIKKRNANRILHERNIYVFLASVAEDAMNNTTLKSSELVGFLLVKKLLQLVEFLAGKMRKKENVFKLELWDMFVDTKDFNDIFMYIEKEHEVFRLYFNSMLDKIQNSPKIINSAIDPQVKAAISSNINQNIDAVLKSMLQDYCHELVQQILTSIKDSKDPEPYRPLMIHADRILDCLRLDQVFQFEDLKNKQQFNFKLYYDEDDKMDIDQLMNKIQTKLFSAIKN